MHYFIITGTIYQQYITSYQNQVGKIATAAEGQAGAVEQVSVGVDQISSVVQTNSATAVQSAAASEELSSQAEVLKNLVSKFSLREEFVQNNISFDSDFDKM